MTSKEDFSSFTPIEHVRNRPDMYIGSIANTKESRWVFYEPEEDDFESSSGSENSLVAKHVTLDYNPGLEQCVLEILTNAADHSQRCLKLVEEGNSKISKVTAIKVELEEDYISVYNNGQGIPLDIHPTAKVPVPEMIFSNLLTSSNYDDTQKKTWGGKNGIGAKAANIFSTKFIVELQTGNKKYYQEFTDNMSNKSKPIITKVTTKGDYTKITYFPDFKAFGMKNFMSNDTHLLVKKRVYDLSATTHKNVSIWYNNERIPVKCFADYMSFFIGRNTKKVVYSNDRWEVGFALCPFSEPTQISFVNSICTEDGGTHVTHVLDPVITRITNELQNSVKSKGYEIKKQYVKNNVIVFIKSIIDNPSFNSQLKRCLTSKVSEFGSRCDIPEDTVKKISKLGITDNIIDIAKADSFRFALKKIDSTKSTNKRLNIESLSDANWAGKSKAMECTLILTEGKSAMGLALNGIPSVGGHDKWGVYPLRGKFLNIMNATPSQLSKNTEIININNIMGLRDDTKNIKELRYGRIMFMTDQDTDGFHIKGLLINYFTFRWPHLVEQGLLECMITPIVKVFRNSNVIEKFFNLYDFKKWMDSNKNKKDIKIKYYKGLGTSTAQDAKDYFSNLSENRISYSFDKERDLSIINRTFEKDKTDERKEWILGALQKLEEIDYNIKNIPIEYFINRELVQFSIYDNIRSIPNVIDGMKPSQRKILYTCLLDNIFENKSIKVAQLSGIVSQKSNYHHGEVSIQSTIVKMAQEFVGTGNMQLLYPSGNFGSRMSNGEDAASARYIFTYLRDVVKILFNNIDNKLLDYIDEEGTRIEPNYYVPIVPMILLNGSTGIGTGWSTNIPCFKLEDIVHNLKALIRDPDSELMDMIPYYKHFKGTIVKESMNSWRSIGVINIVKKNVVEITEIPVGDCKEEYKKFLNKLMDDDGIVENITINDNNKKFTSNDICYLVKLREVVTSDDIPRLIKLFKLEKTISGSNMVAFDENMVIQKYYSVEEILWTFYEVRLKFYDKRYKYITDMLTEKLRGINEKIRFVTMIVNNEIVVFKKSKKEIKEILESHEFEEHEMLLNMSIYKFTKEEIEKLKKESEEVGNEIKIHNNKTSKDLWLEDLDLLLKQDLSSDQTK